MCSACYGHAVGVNVQNNGWWYYKKNSFLGVKEWNLIASISHMLAEKSSQKQSYLFLLFHIFWDGRCTGDPITALKHRKSLISHLINCPSNFYPISPLKNVGTWTTVAPINFHWFCVYTIEVNGCSCCSVTNILQISYSVLCRRKKLIQETTRELVNDERTIFFIFLGELFS